MEEESLKAQMELLSELLQDNSIPEHPDLVNTYKEVYRFINTDFENVVNDSHLVNRDGLMDSLKSALNGVELFNDYPEMAGDTFIGVWKSNGSRNEQISGRSFSARLAHRLQIQDYGIPVILTHGDEEEIFVENVFSLRLEISREKYDRLLELPQSGIDLKKIIQFLCITDPDIAADCTIVKFPENADWDAETVKSLINKLDYVLIYWDPLEHRRIEDFTIQLKRRHIPFSIVCREEGDLKLIANIVGNVDVRIFSKITPEFIRRKTVSRKNYIFTDAMYEELFRAEEKLYTNIARLKREVKLLRNDIVNLGGNSSGAGKDMYELKGFKQKALKDNEDRLRAFRVQARKLLGKASLLEDKYNEFAIQDSDMSGDYRYSPMTCFHYLNAGISALKIYGYSGQEDSQNLKFASACQEKLLHTSFEYGYILRLYLADITHSSPNSSDLNKLRLAEDDSELIAKAKIQLHDHLHLSMDELVKEIRHIAHPETPFEMYLQGVDYIRTGRNRDAFYRLLKSWEMGYSVAEDKLYDLALQMNEKSDFNSVENLANYMVPKACMSIGLQVLKEKYKYFKHFSLKVPDKEKKPVHFSEKSKPNYAINRAISMLKVAAANGFWQAKLAIADYYFCKVPVAPFAASVFQPKGVVKKFAKNPELAKLLIDMYNGLDSEEDNGWKLDCRFKKGMLYYSLGNYREAFKILSKENIDYPEAWFLCGEMYYEGKGTYKDLDKAEAFVKISVDRQWYDYQGWKHALTFLRENF